MKKRLFLITLSIFIISSVFCAPSKRMVLDYIQSNGYILKIKIIGDEKVQRYFTIDNISISKDADNNFYYTEIYENQLICGDIIAKNPEDRNSDESEFVNELQNDYNEFITTYLTNQNYSSISRSAAVADSKQTFTGLHKYPVILVQFSDVKFSSENPQEIFNNFFNEEGYSHEGATGSVKDYFTEQSSGKYVPQFDVLGPITLNNKQSYYGGDNSYNIDVNIQSLLKEATTAVRDQISFENYDNNNDSKIDLVFVVYAGYGQSQTGVSNHIWPHYSYLSSNNCIEKDNISTYKYACSNELMYSSGTTIDGIGTVCHEFGHFLGLPDFYDTSGNTTNFGLGMWDIMDTGNYNNEGRTPPSYSGYERYFMGWLEPNILTSPESVALSDLQQNNLAYMLPSGKNSNEYFFLENRQKNGWDTYLPASGLLITRINYIYSRWANNIVNTSQDKQLVTIIPADNELLPYMIDDRGYGNYYDFYDNMLGDPYPGNTNNTEFTSTSVPASTLYDGTIIDKPITSIKEDNNIIYFDFMGGSDYKTDDNYTSISDFELNERNFYIYGNTIFFLCESENLYIEIFNSNGIMLQNSYINKDENITLPCGIYIIRCNGRTSKIIIR